MRKRHTSERSRRVEKRIDRRIGSLDASDLNHDLAQVVKSTSEGLRQKIVDRVRAENSKDHKLLDAQV